jgi:hypothetical protein
MMMMISVRDVIWIVLAFAISAAAASVITLALVRP